MALGYRPEIDGLRAVAVISVILFHAGLHGVPGGYIGVDVFFVISGYLITSIILNEIRAGTFTIASFYDRRARRILPALFFVMVLSIPFAWFVLTPSELKRFSVSFASTVLFLSNIHFMKNAGYFESDAENQPLLHTWSLAVEEQYYILFPLLLIMLVKRKKQLLLVLGALMIAGLAYAEIKTGAGSKKVFLDTRGRGWAILAGALIPMLDLEVLSRGVAHHTREILAAIGFVVVIACFFVFSNLTPYPGLYTTVPVLGTVLVIIFAASNTLTGQVLGWKPLVGIGLVSYSAYLIHQPLFAFYRLRSGEEMHGWQSFVLSVSVLVLAFFSWKYIETPFRDRKRYSRRVIFLGTGLTGSVLIALAWVTYANNGFFGLPGRDQDVMIYARYPRSTLYREGVCFLESEQDEKSFGSECLPNDQQSGGILIWGDSHAAAMSVGVREYFPNRVAQYTSSGCPPLLLVDKAGLPHCRSVNEYISRQISTLRPSVVLLHANWKVSAANIPLARLRDTILTIKKISPKTQVLVIGGVPSWTPNLPNQLRRSGIGLNSEAVLGNTSLGSLREMDKNIRQVAEKSGAEFVSTLDVFCTHEKCLAVTWNQKLARYEPVAWDDAHLTEAGSLKLAQVLFSHFAPPMASKSLSLRATVK